MSTGSTQLGDLKVAVAGAAEALAQQLAAGTTFAQLPPGGPGVDGHLFPSPLALSGGDTLPLGSSSVTLGAAASYQVYALTGAFQDPDGIESPATGGGAAWLKHQLAAQVSGSGSGGKGDLSVGLDAGATVRLLDYRRHLPTDPVAKSVLDEIAHPRWPNRMADLQALAAGDALALVAAGNLAFRAAFTYADLIPATVSVLDEALGVAGAAAFQIATGASVTVDFGASDQFRLVFSKGTTLDIAVDLEKVKATTLSAGAQLGFTAAFTDPAQLTSLVESYVVARLGAPYQKVQGLIADLTAATDLSRLSPEDQQLFQEIVTKLGLDATVTKFQDLRAKIVALPGELHAKLQAGLSQKLQFAFAASYSRVETDHTLASFEAKAASLAPLLPSLLVGNVAKLADALFSGDPGFVLHNYLSSHEITQQLSFGVSLSIGGWAAVGKTTTTTTESTQVNGANETRQSFGGQTAYASKWGKEGENYAFELTAAMPGFVARPTTGDFELGMKLSWVWDNQALTPRLRGRILDLANVWGVFGQERNAADVAALSALAGHPVHAELSLTVPDAGVRRLPIVPAPQLQAAWIQAMAVGLPRVFLPSSNLAVDSGQRGAIYQGIAAWIFGQKSGAEIGVLPAYGAAQPPLSAPDQQALRQIDISSGPSLDANTTVYSLDTLWSPTSSTVKPWHRYQKLVVALAQLNGFLEGPSLDAIGSVFADLASLAEEEYLARLLGSVVSQVLGGAVGLVSGALSISPMSGGQAVVFAGGPTTV